MVALSREYSGSYSVNPLVAVKTRPLSYILGEIEAEKGVEAEKMSLFSETYEYQTTSTNTYDFANSFANPDKIKFFQLVKQWKTERGITSSVSDMIKCASYRSIIAMGQEALPLILTQLRREGGNPDHWFIALESITGEDPVPESAYGDMVKMAEAWLSWAGESNVW